MADLVPRFDPVFTNMSHHEVYDNLESWTVLIAHYKRTKNEIKVKELFDLVQRMHRAIGNVIDVKYNQLYKKFIEVASGAELTSPKLDYAQAVLKVLFQDVPVAIFNIFHCCIAEETLREFPCLIETWQPLIDKYKEILTLRTEITDLKTKLRTFDDV